MGEWMSSTCDVCKRERETVVCSSALGPMSNAYCGDCHPRHAEPEWMFHFTYEQTDGQVADWVRELRTYREGEYLTWDQWLAALGMKDSA